MAQNVIITYGPEFPGSGLGLLHVYRILNWGTEQPGNIGFWKHIFSLLGVTSFSGYKYENDTDLISSNSARK